ncbi:phage terminase small subunit [Brachybacterium alimentarium]|uniref:phage terminase small subunit n=1 Tax=Brachybacterium alimentarium TaxID=47845 RepID=UPI003FD1C787
MAGRGRPPKDPSRLAGHGAAKARASQLRVIVIDPVEQPPLPEMPGGEAWPELTRDWWARWAEEPMSREFSGPDWAFLMDTALLHAAVWGKGEMRWAGELRLRTAKYGVTPEDKARLRIQYASADGAEHRRDQSGAGARARRGEIRALKPDEIGSASGKGDLNR